MFELMLSDNRVVTWPGSSGEDAARRYVDAHREAAVVAWRYPRVDVRPARNAARVARRDQIHADVRPAALELGFAWCCTHEEQVPSYRDDVPMCEASGWDRGEYETHMRGHGRRAIHGTKIIKLRRKAPAATMPKLEIDPLAEITWTESEAHSQPMTGIPANKVDRRGQFWALGGDAHSAWVLPYEAAPWETGRPALVLVYAGSAGKFFTESYSAKWDRR